MTQPEPTAAMTATDLAGQVYTRILGILSNRIWTGAETLNDVTLAQSLGVSRTPVRLALAKLANEGLVRKMPGKGWVPIALTLKDIRDIFEIKEALEAQAVRRAAELITPAAAEELRGVVQQMHEAESRCDLRRWIQADDSFYQLLFKIDGNERLTHTIELLDSQWYRYRMGYLAQENCLGVLYEEHRPIAEAVIAGDGDGASVAIIQHLTHVRNQILKITRDVLMPFLGIADAPVDARIAREAR